MIGEIQQRFKGTVEDFWSEAKFLAEYKNPYGPVRVSYPQLITGVSIKFSIGENGWALAQRLPNGGCAVTVAAEGEDEVMWQRLHTHLEARGWFDTLSQPAAPDTNPRVSFTGYVTPQGASAATIQPSGLPVWVTPAAMPDTIASGAKDNGHYAHSPAKRAAIVSHYRQDRDAGKIAQKESWAQSNYQITAKTLKSYEKEFPAET